MATVQVEISKKQINVAAQKEIDSLKKKCARLEKKVRGLETVIRDNKDAVTKAGKVISVVREVCEIEDDCSDW